MRIIDDFFVMSGFFGVLSIPTALSGQSALAGGFVIGAGLFAIANAVLQLAHKKESPANKEEKSKKFVYHYYAERHKDETLQQFEGLVLSDSELEDDDGYLQIKEQIKQKFSLNDAMIEEFVIKSLSFISAKN